MFAVDDTIILDGSQSSDPDVEHGDSIVTYRWDFDYDGQNFNTDVEVTEALYTVPEDTFTAGEEVTIALQVEDSQGGVSLVDTATLIIVTDTPPVADAGGPYVFTEGTEGNLNGTGSNDDNQVVTYQWDLDYDGQTFDVDLTGVEPPVTFKDDMVGQTIALRVIDDADQISEIDTATLTVINADPTADIAELPTDVLEGHTVTMTGLVDDLGDEDTHEFDWTITLGGIQVATGTGENFSFVPQEDGVYDVTLTVTDDDGGDATVTDTVTILNADPEAGNVSLTPTVTVDGQTLIESDQAVTLSGSFTDPGSLDTHTVSIDWGDGTTSDATVDQDAGTYQAVHTYASSGPYAIVATVTDDENASHEAETIVNVVNELGVVDFKDDLLDQDPSDGDLWYLLTAAHNGYLTVELGDPGAESASAALFDSEGNPVNAMENGPSDGADFLVTAQAEYYLKLAGADANVGIRLTNLVSVDGAGVTVTGTDDDDAFEFELTDSYFVRINGTQYHFEDADGVVETVTFDGGLGTDTATFTGSEADESARFFTGSGEFYSGKEVYDETGFFVDAIAEHLVAYSEGGLDYAKMYDSAGDDVFTSSPTMSSLVGPGYSHTVHDFYVGLGYATNREGEDRSGGNDQAFMTDSAGNDKFKLDWPDAKQFFGKLYAGDYYTRAKNFESIDAQASDGTDRAVVFGAPVDNEFFLKRGVGQLTTQRTNVDFLGFDIVTAYAGEGYDTVLFEDSNQNDKLRGRSHKTTMTGDDYSLAARGFEEVKAEAKNGGDRDRANLHDTSLDDILHAEERSGQTWAQLAIDGAIEDPLYEVLAFEFVKAYSTNGEDKVDRAEEFIWLILDGDWIDE